MDMSQFAYDLYKLVLTFRDLVSQDTPSFLFLPGCVLTFIVGNILSLNVTEHRKREHLGQFIIL